ncbi:NADH ubiquinone oxidoreductase 20 kDa subunit [Thiorhodococcus drewsii AZ1]|uniref:NADH ubiquinone oxidoreductase 20 kDa subunit n=1 Tax=Thiorhodococcus drewsii AZ1 TaxID=765913 RepID=G2E6E4_9GAMM|nr:NADH-quinone oxidoreductase subunit B family protein [Thiorhodococcus drewsii]EGV28344.1 NADH ubiquinone oxidoreductase 20 kDa subunit [Thiorhodococcus drewsii AZ1]
MFRILKQALTPGVVTEPVSDPTDAELERIGVELRRRIDARFGHSLAIRQVDAGSCNGCELEIHALNNPYHDVERFGVHFVASPRHADVLLVTGPVSRHMETALRRTWRATPAPKFVIAAGDCACTGGEFGVSYASCGAVENVVPVDVKIPGCPPTPVELLQGLLAALREGSA